MIAKFFYDLETTGTNERIHGIHQIAGCIEIDGEIKEHFNFKVAPNPKAKIDPAALAHSKVTEDQIKAYEPMQDVYRKVIKLLGKYVDRYDSKAKYYLIGFNNRKFDDVFFRCWFEQNHDSFFGSWFWTDSHDALVFASVYLMHRRPSMPSFKLKRVAIELGIDVDPERLHDAEYDTMILYKVYRIVTGIDVEL